MYMYTPSPSPQIYPTDFFAPRVFFLTASVPFCDEQTFSIRWLDQSTEKSYTIIVRITVAGRGQRRLRIYNKRVDFSD